MKKDVSFYIKDILECINKIEEYTKDKEKDIFYNDPELQDAVVRRIEIIGEATKHIPDEIRQKYPDIPWKDIAGMRDVVIHHYDMVDLEEVWKVIKENIPAIKPVIKQAYEDLRKQYAPPA
ncbi:MAG TPA: hypothetical protein DCX95_06260 [Elusimicrobia bacterium]|nr:hypothetical protein [Elusimicrobiota bacterium]